MLTQSMVAASTAAIAQAHGALADARGERFAAFGFQLFAVVQAAHRPLRRKHHGRRYHRAEQRPTAHFIHPRHGRKAARAQLPLQRRFAPELGARGFGSHGRCPRLLAFSQTGGLALQAAQVIQLGPAHLARAHHVDVIDHLRMDREDALHSLAEADLANRDGLAQAGIVAGDQRSFESLEALFVAFLDLDVDPQGVAGPELGDSRPACSSE